MVKKLKRTEDPLVEYQRLLADLDRLEEALRDRSALEECERKVKELREHIRQYLLRQQSN